jgi:hypothetical protein
MNSLMNQFYRKFWLALLIFGVFALCNLTVAQAAVSWTTNQTDWETEAATIEVFSTIADNVSLADEVVSLMARMHNLARHCRSKPSVPVYQ